ncbi:unnamed protein product [Dracunculus medinensis]|uniref:Charged multivesicular body protein 2b n=1 Tax=Dracunculus medinensis TaxID=318479 RepID=A0A0N4UAG5_DRAME|nr:unnamed protein product [Dracunculus medinensis]
MFLFKQNNPKEEIRANERILRQTTRELDRDRRQMEMKEQELIKQIKKMAQMNQREACNILAKQLVLLRKQKTANLNLCAKISSTASQNKQISSAGKIAQAVGRTTKAMQKVEKEFPAEKLMKNMRDFTNANDRLGMNEEIINDTLDAIMDESGDEEEENAIINQALDEIGIDLNAQLSKAPKSSLLAGPSSVSFSSKTSQGNLDLEKMLANLK